jgi:hypothetical protein
VGASGFDQRIYPYVSRSIAHGAIDYASDHPCEVVLPVSLLQLRPGKLVGLAIPLGHDLANVCQEQRIE